MNPKQVINDSLELARNRAGVKKRREKVNVVKMNAVVLQKREEVSVFKGGVMSKA